MHKRLSKIEIILTRTRPVVEVIKRHKRHADMELYGVLKDCMEIAEVCLRDQQEYEVLNRLIKELPLINGKKRQYVEGKSDIYQRVCRYVFHGEEHTANTYRYAHCLRQAAERGIKSTKLVKELSEGGVNKFFMARPSQAREVEVRTKCIRLDRQIKHMRRDPITLTLKRKGDGSYRVIEQR